MLWENRWLHVKEVEVLYSYIVWSVYGNGNLICIMGELQHLDTGLNLYKAAQYNFINP